METDYKQAYAAEEFRQEQEAFARKFELRAEMERDFRIEISDLSDKSREPRVYVIDDPSEAHDDVDRDVAQHVADHNDHFKIGMVLGRPVAVDTPKGEAEVKKWTKVEIREKLETSDKWVERGIVAIHKKQTHMEQLAHETVEDNGVGFNGVDAEFLSSLAEWINSGRHLTDGQLKYGRKKILKYAGQLAKIANGKL